MADVDVRVDVRSAPGEGTTVTLSGMPADSGQRRPQAIGRDTL